MDIRVDHSTQIFKSITFKSIFKQKNLHHIHFTLDMKYLSQEIKRFNHQMQIPVDRQTNISRRKNRQQENS